MSTVSKTMDAVIVTGEYTDQQGQPKKRYMNIGTLFVYQDGGMSLKLDAVPVGNGNISFYDKKPKGQQQPQAQGYGQPAQQGYAQPQPRQQPQQQPQGQQPQIQFDQDGNQIPF